MGYLRKDCGMEFEYFSFDEKEIVERRVVDAHKLEMNQMLVRKSVKYNGGLNE